MLTPFERGVIAHLIADWLLQNDWMAANKSNLRHPAAWVHSGIHFTLLWVALGWQAGLVLAALHLLIDLRGVTQWWQGLIQQTANGPSALHVRIWADQVLHIVLIGLWVMFVR